jgi:hypothetical protein
MHICGVEEFTLSLEIFASIISSAKRKTSSNLLIDACIVRRIVLVCKAHITTKHHLYRVGWIRTSVDTIELMMGCVDSLWCPSLENERFVIVIVENTLVGSVTPESNETRVFSLGLTKSVSTRNSSSESPSSSAITPSIIEDMVNENSFQVSTTSLSIWK